MGISQQVITRFGVTPVMNVGTRARIDPELVNEEGVAVAPQAINVITPGFILVSQQVVGGVPTFDLQNISGLNQVCEWEAVFHHSVQHNAAQAQQTTVGAGGNITSPDAPLNAALRNAALPGISSDDETGTGALQTIAHNLGVIPRAVVVFTTGGPNGTDYTVVQGAHTTTDILLTVTLNITYTWVAFA
jgi:hypothetical protein